MGGETTQAKAEEQRYAAAWRDRHRRVWLVWLSTYGGIAAGCALAAFAVHLKSWGLFAFAAIAWFFPGQLAQLYLTQFQCPRCDESFYFVPRQYKNTHLTYWRRRGESNPRLRRSLFTPRWKQGGELGRCVNCYLPVNAPRDPDPPAGPDDI